MSKLLTRGGVWGLPLPRKKEIKNNYIVNCTITRSCSHSGLPIG